MKKLLISTGAIALGAIAFAATEAANDPVLMTVNGKKVHKSEFEYLYHKNNQQQQQPQTIDEYLKMFIDYKLKVADAETAKLDTTKQFREEFKSSCDELAQPYMIDSLALNELVEEAYGHVRENVNVSHIMVYPGPTEELNDSVMNALKDMRTRLLNGTADWKEMVEKYTVDRGTRDREGLMGWLTPGAFPWPFEKAAYETPKGQISPVINSGFGYHLIRVNDRRPAAGEVKASHILLLTANKSPEEQAAAKVKIDSLYQVLKNGADFAETAKKYSEDPGSAGRGGDLGWFGPGRMVAPFDSAAFAIADGTLSTPFQTNFGWHIINRESSRPVASIAEMRQELINQINSDQRGRIPYERRMQQLVQQHSGKILDSGIDRVMEIVRKAGAYDTAVAKAVAVCQAEVVQVGKNKFTMAEAAKYMPVLTTTDLDYARNSLKNAAKSLMEQEVIEAERAQMINSNPEYRNLVNEYRDGILLFDISNRKVWDKASKDKNGLDNYFAAHRNDYKWTAPKFKGYIVFAKNDSVMQLAKTYCDQMDANFNPDTFVSQIKDRFGKDIRVERVIAAQGENPITDFLAFGGPKPKDPKKIRWNDYFAFRGKIIEQPEEVADVRGAVITDYQSYLEKQWLEYLHKRYKVKVNEKVLKTVR